MIMQNRSFIPAMLARQPLFRELCPHELELLAQGTHEHRVGKDELIYPKGATPGGLHVLVTGQVKLTLMGANGVEKIAALAHSGETFAEECLIQKRPSPFSAQAVRESILLVVGQAPLMQVMQTNANLANALFACMGARLCHLAASLETCVQRGSTQRVAHFFSQRAPQNADSYDIELETDKQTIAAQLNLAPETFSRTLRKLSQDGLIHVRGRTVSLRDLTTLRALAG